jgi:imidazolonepropionase-like amidohydrolase
MNLDVCMKRKVSATEWPTNAEVVDVAGKTILPGLIDLHTHLTYPLTEGDVQHAPSEADAPSKSSATFWRAELPA